MKEVFYRVIYETCKFLATPLIKLGNWASTELNFIKWGIANTDKSKEVKK